MDSIESSGAATSCSVCGVPRKRGAVRCDMCGAGFEQVAARVEKVAENRPPTGLYLEILRRARRLAETREVRALVPIVIAFALLIALGSVARPILTRVLENRRTAGSSPGVPAESPAGSLHSDDGSIPTRNSDDVSITATPDLLPTEGDGAGAEDSRRIVASMEAPVGFFAFGLMLFLAVLTALFVFKGFFLWCTAQLLGMKRGIEFAWNATFLGFFVSVPILLFAYLGSRSMSQVPQYTIMLAASVLGGLLGIRMAYMEGYRRSLLADLIAELPTALAAAVAVRLVSHGFAKGAPTPSEIPARASAVGIFALGFWFVMVLGLAVFLIRGFFVWRTAQFFGMNRRFSCALQATFLGFLISIPTLLVSLTVFRSMSQWAHGMIFLAASIVGGTIGLVRAYGERWFRSLLADLALELLTGLAALAVNAVLIAPLQRIR